MRLAATWPLQFNGMHTAVLKAVALDGNGLNFMAVALPIPPVCRCVWWCWRASLGLRMPSATEREQTWTPAPRQRTFAFIRQENSGNEAAFARRRPPGGLPW